jgi:SARP family transcriptional regulator, regulator of embCAB operon
MATETVAVLFTDLVDSTGLMSRFGEEQAESLRRAHMALLRSSIALHGGREIKNLGDGLMVSFASPSAAIAAAVGMQQAVAEDNRKQAEPLGLRIGVAVGEAEADDGDYFGRPVVEAARLCALAGAGEVLATGIARALAGGRGDHQFVSRGSVHLKGLEEPTEVALVNWKPLPPSKDAELTVRVLGPIEVLIDGTLVAVAGPKQRAVVATLALDVGRIVPVGVLVDAVWGDPVPDRAEHSLQQHVSSLRKVLGPAAGRSLTTRSPGYALDGARVDASEFEAAAARGHQLIVSGQPEDAIDVLGQALELWRGPALANANGTHRLAAAAVRLEERRLAAIEDRNDALLAVGRAREVVDGARHHLHDHPRRERLWAQLMLALYRSGRQADALAAYGEARRTLIDELGIEPGGELRALERAILEQQPSLDLGETDRADSSAGAEDLFATFKAGAGPRLGHLELPDGQIVVLLEGSSTIGRDPASLVRLIDNRVSRLHARIDAGPDGCTLVDLGSSNGTQVAGARISEHRLHSGDLISLGGVEVRFHGPA